MGLRLWKDPDEEVNVEEVAAKLDRAAAARRSTIRRETSIRPNRDYVPPQSISSFHRSRHHNILRTRDRLRREEQENDAQLIRLQADLDQLRRIRLASRVRQAGELGSIRAVRDTPNTSSPTEPTNSDENNGTNVEAPSDIQGSALPRPPRESNLRFELPQSSSSRPSSPWQYNVLSRTHMPSPPRPADNRRPDLSIPDGPIPGDSWSNDIHQMPALTEGFAPARSTVRRSSQQHDSQRPDEDFQGLETPPPEPWESLFPPLQRVSHTSPRPLSRVDGLGDRRRSLSPPTDQDEEDSWMLNLLTTMDTSQSSSSSSFASTHSDSVRRSNNSSQATSTSFGEIGSLDDTCELDLPEGITADDVRTIRERHYSSNRHSPSHRRIQAALGSIRQHMDETGNTEYRTFDAIAERMLTRQRVPQDWWVIIGLPSDFGRRST